MTGAGFIIIYGEMAYVALLCSGFAGMVLGSVFALLAAILRINQVIAE